MAHLVLCVEVEAQVLAAVVIAVLSWSAVNFDWEWISGAAVTCSSVVFLVLALLDEPFGGSLGKRFFPAMMIFVELRGIVIIKPVQFVKDGNDANVVHAVNIACIMMDEALRINED